MNNRESIIWWPWKSKIFFEKIDWKKFSDKDINIIISDLAYKNKIIKCGDLPKIQINSIGKDKFYFSEEIAAMILKKLKENGERFLNQKIKKGVITTPAYFTRTQREAIKITGESVGLEIIKMINEPTAATLANGLKAKKDLMEYNEDDNFSR